MYFLSYLLEIINIWFKVEINFEFTISRHSLQLVYRLGPSREIMWFWPVILFENFAASIIWFDFCLINNIISLCNSSLQVMKLPFQLEELSPLSPNAPVIPQSDEGTKIIFQCRLVGEPNPSLTWLQSQVVSSCPWSMTRRCTSCAVWRFLMLRPVM